MRSPYSILPALLALTVLASTAHAQDEALRERAGQTIRGEVLDAETRIPLPGANIVLLQSEPFVGTATDANGQFVLPGIPLGRQQIRVTFIGYAPVILSEILVTAGKETYLQVKLHEQAILADEIVVRPERQKERALNDLAVVSARSFSVEETRRYAGGLDDPARMASAFAGVTTGGSIQENALIIRGNAPKGVLWQLEGVEIPNPNHFAGLSVAGGGGLTLFSSQLLADSDFLTGAFPAEYGNALAGVFDMRFRSGNPATREHEFQVGALGIEAASEGPFVQGKQATYLMNYRYSTLALLLPLLPTEDIARYQDLSFKLSFPTRSWGRFDIWGIGGLDGQTLKPERDSTRWEYETWDRLDTSLRLGVGAAGVGHSYIIGPNTLLRSTVASTISSTHLEQLRINNALQTVDDLYVANTELRLSAHVALNHKMSARHTLRAGVRLQRIGYDLDLQATPDRASPLVPIAVRSGAMYLTSAYVQSKLALASNVTLSTGLNGQYHALARQSLLEPRIGLRWQVASDQAINVGYGLHSRLEDARFYFIEPPQTTQGQPNRGLTLARAHHGVLGYDRTLTPNARLKLELYYQSLFDVPVVQDSSFSFLNFEQDWGFDHALVNEGAGYNYGIDLTLERFLNDGYYFLMTGTLYKSRYRGGDGIWRATRFDRTFSVNALFGKEWTLGDDDLLGMNVRLNAMGGKRRSPLDLEASLRSEEVIPDATRAFEERNPPIFLVDLSVTYRRNRTRRASVWALQIKNMLGAKDTLRDYNYRTQRIEEVREGFPIPVLSYSVEF